LIHDSFDTLDPGYRFLRQLCMKKTVQVTSKHENSFVVLAKHLTQGSVRACTEASFRNRGNFKRRDMLLHLDGHMETTSLIKDALPGTTAPCHSTDKAIDCGWKKTRRVVKTLEGGSRQAGWLWWARRTTNVVVSLESSRGRNDNFLLASSQSPHLLAAMMLPLAQFVFVNVKSQRFSISAISVTWVRIVWNKLSVGSIWGLGQAATVWSLLDRHPCSC
jgi:hypothetical protein